VIGIAIMVVMRGVFLIVVIIVRGGVVAVIIS
jgi:hypothetical protein